MTSLAPPARFRIYTKARDYISLLASVLTGKERSSDATAELERAICEKFDVPYALCVPQGRVGIYLAIKGSIKPGQKVVLSPYTIADVINMVICAGGVPVFADIDRPTTNIRADEVEKLIDEHTGAVMVTHLHGMACEIEEIAEICKRRNVPLIEDAAQSLGAKVNGRRVGTFGDAGVFSFGMYKNVTAFYGGVVVTHDEALYKRMRQELDNVGYMPMGILSAKVFKALFTDISTMPALFKSMVYWIFRFGYLHKIQWINKFVTVELDTSRKNSIPPVYLRKFRPAQASIVMRQLDSIDANSATRIRYSKLYHEGLRDIPGLIIPPFRDDGSYIYNYFPIQYENRAELVRWAMQHRRDMAVQHLKNCAALPSFAPEFRECPNADLTANQVILLPNYPSYGEESVKQNIAVIRDFFAADRARLDERDIADIAHLHVTSLKDSLVSELGHKYAESFYRYVDASPKEIVLVERGADDRIIAGAVLSLDPHSLNRRLLLGTPLLLSCLTHITSFVPLLYRTVTGSRSGGHFKTPDLPELILIFASPETRGKGVGRALVHAVEEKLRQIGISEFQVKTVAESSNRALGFYKSLDFIPVGETCQQGRLFQVFTKDISVAN